MDAVEAYAWFNLAADGGRKDAAERLSEISATMTIKQIAAGLRLVREYYKGDAD